MAWLESHQSLQRHPKTHRLARSLGISTPTTVGHLLCLWWWCMDYAKGGDLTGYEVEDIADAAMWDGDPVAFFDALTSVGFLDQDEIGVFVHDWDQYGGKYEQAKENNRERQRRFRERKRDESTPYNGGNGHVTVTSPSDNALEKRTVEERTVEERTEQKTTKGVRGESNGADAPVVVACPSDIDPRVFDVLDIFGEARSPDHVKYVAIKIAAHPSLNPVAAALETKEYISRSRRTYKKPLLTWSNWMKNDEKPPPWDRTQSNGASSNGGPPVVDEPASHDDILKYIQAHSPNPNRWQS